MELSIIFVNWNSVNYLRDCIASIYEYTQGVSLEIIVVDNASPEGGLGALGQQFPKVNIIRSSENLGFARANNLGSRHSSGKYLLFLNPDTRLVTQAIDIMLEHMKSLPDAGIVGCKHLSPDLSVQTCAIQKFPTILNQVLGIEQLRRRWPHCRLWEISPLFSNNAKPTKVEVIPGACMMLRREVFERVGGFSEDYFMYAEDIDLNYKVACLGLDNYYVGEAAIIHYGGQSSRHQKVSQWATIMKFKAMLHFYMKTRGRVYAAMYRAAMGCVAMGRLIILALMFPLGGFVWDKGSIREASAKWSAVLKWAAGLDDRTLRTTSTP
jgi:hypothetical protein